MMLATQMIVALVTGTAVAAAATPLVKKLAFRIGAVDIPKDDRRMHSKPVARIGGLAIIAGFAAAIAVSCIAVGKSPVESGIFLSFRQFYGFIAGALIIAAVGVIDDIRPLPSRTKLIFQLAAAILVVVTGTHIEILTNPFSDSGIIELAPYISYPLSVMWIVAATNAINLIDGLDGLAAGISFISSISLMTISILLGRWEAAVIPPTATGSPIGSLPYNFNPAKIFMGDTGATFLGFTLAVISVQSTLKSYAAIAVAIPILVLGLPLFDTLLAILRRLISGKPVMQPDRGHLHHKLIDMGISHRKSVIIMYIFSALLGIFAIVLADKSIFSTALLILAVSVIAVWALRYAANTRRQRRNGGGQE